MKRYILLLVIITLCVFSCAKKDKFECSVQNQTAPADDSSVLFMPTAFSPNGDGLNDGFLVMAKNVDSLHFEIYDLENNLIFQTDTLWKPWSPTLNISEGIQLFHYKLTAVSHQGYSYDRCGDFYAYRCLPKDFDASVLIFADQYDPTAPEGYIKSASLENLTACQ